jgi:hypothetical protein
VKERETIYAALLFLWKPTPKFLRITGRKEREGLRKKIT